MTAALEGGEWSAARPDHTLPPGKNRYPFYRRLSGPQGRSGRAENLFPTGIRSRTIHYKKKTSYISWSLRKHNTVVIRSLARIEPYIQHFMMDSVTVHTVFIPHNVSEHEILGLQTSFGILEP